MTNSNVMEFGASISEADLDAAHKFIQKRVRRHGDDVLAGAGAALYSIMHEFAEGLAISGVPADQITSVFDQTKFQVLANVVASEGASA